MSLKITVGLDKMYYGDETNWFVVAHSKFIVHNSFLGRKLNLGHYKRLDEIPLALAGFWMFMS